MRDRPTPRNPGGRREGQGSHSARQVPRRGPTSRRRRREPSAVRASGVQDECGTAVVKTHCKGIIKGLHRVLITGLVDLTMAEMCMAIHTAILGSKSLHL